MKKSIKLIRALALVLALVLCAAMPVPTLAADIDQSAGQGASPVVYSVNPTYTVTIPPNVTLSETTGEVTETVKATNVKITEGEQLKVSLTGSFELTAGGTYKLPYTVTVGDAAQPIASGDKIATFVSAAEAVGAEQLVSLKFKAATPKYAGSYTGTVTFTVAVEFVQPVPLSLSARISDRTSSDAVTGEATMGSGIAGGSTQQPTQSGNTSDGLWTLGDEVAVRVNSDVRKYTPAVEDLSSASLQADPGATPFCWQTPAERMPVSAWYCGTGYSALPPTTWSVKSDQSGDGYRTSKFLYAPATDITFNTQNTPLAFYQHTAKVVINIRNQGMLADASRIDAISINNVKLNGDFSEPVSGSHYGLTVTASAPQTTPITPKQLQAAEDVNFGGGSSPETALASYEALVIPQTVESGADFISITVDGDIYCYQAEAGRNELKAGQVHTYNITVSGKGLSVIVNSSIGWGTDDIIDSGTGRTNGTGNTPSVTGDAQPGVLKEDIYDNSSFWAPGKTAQFGVRIGNGASGVYSLTNNNVTASTPAYWQSAADGQTVTAWYPAHESASEIIDVSNQIAGLAYVLKAATTANYNTVPSLSFLHQLAKVQVIVGGTAGNTAEQVFLKYYAQYTVTNGEVALAPGATEQMIAMHKTEYGVKTCFEATVIPGTLNASDLFVVTASDGTSSSDIGLSSSHLTLEAGKIRNVHIQLEEAP